jgi:hypothetical protein
VPVSESAGAESKRGLNVERHTMFGNHHRRPPAHEGDNTLTLILHLFRWLCSRPPSDRCPLVYQRMTCCAKSLLYTYCSERKFRRFPDILFTFWGCASRARISQPAENRVSGLPADLRFLGWQCPKDAADLFDRRISHLLAFYKNV